MHRPLADVTNLKPEELRYYFQKQIQVNGAAFVVSFVETIIKGIQIHNSEIDRASLINIFQVLASVMNTLGYGAKFVLALFSNKEFDNYMPQYAGAKDRAKLVKGYVNVSLTFDWLTAIASQYDFVTLLYQLGTGERSWENWKNKFQVAVNGAYYVANRASLWWYGTPKKQLDEALPATSEQHSLLH